LFTNDGLTPRRKKEEERGGEGMEGREVRVGEGYRRGGRGCGKYRWK
jgi:hypothetical protein